MSDRRKDASEVASAPPPFYFPYQLLQRHLSEPSLLPVSETAGFAEVSAYCFFKKNFFFQKYLIFPIDSKETWVFTDVSIIEMPHRRVSKTVYLVVFTVQIPNVSQKSL